MGLIACVHHDKELLAYQCPLCSYSIRDRDNSHKKANYRGLAEANHHIATKHPYEAQQDIVWRARFLDTGRTHPSVVTHYMYYHRCRGKGHPITRIHSIAPPPQRAGHKRSEPDTSASASHIHATVHATAASVSNPDWVPAHETSVAAPAQEAIGGASVAAPAQEAIGGASVAAPARGGASVAVAPTHEAMPGYQALLQAAVEASKHSKVKFTSHGFSNGFSNGFTMEFSPPSPPGPG